MDTPSSSTSATSTQLLGSSAVVVLTMLSSSPRSRLPENALSQPPLQRAGHGSAEPQRSSLPPLAASPSIAACYRCLLALLVTAVQPRRRPLLLFTASEAPARYPSITSLQLFAAESAISMELLPLGCADPPHILQPPPASSSALSKPLSTTGDTIASTPSGSCIPLSNHLQQTLRCCRVPIASHSRELLLAIPPRVPHLAAPSRRPPNFSPVDFHRPRLRRRYQPCVWAWSSPLVAASTCEPALLRRRALQFPASIARSCKASSASPPPRPSHPRADAPRRRAIARQSRTCCRRSSMSPRAARSLRPRMCFFTAFRLWSCPASASSTWRPSLALPASPWRQSALAAISHGPPPSSVPPRCTLVSPTRKPIVNEPPPRHLQVKLPRSRQPTTTLTPLSPHKPHPP